VEVWKNGQSCGAAKPLLRQIARELNLPTVNANGNELNTRQLGKNVIAHLSESDPAGQDGASTNPTLLERE